ncbi:hypothetical protein Tco_1339977, partial [Tanacetum coccineum]
LEKTDGNAEFHKIIDFFTQSSIRYALTVYYTQLLGKPRPDLRGIYKEVNLLRDVIGLILLNNRDEGEASKRPSESQPIPSPSYPSEDQPKSQPDPSPIDRSPSFLYPLFPIWMGFGGNHGVQSSSDKSLLGNEDGLTL